MDKIYKCIGYVVLYPSGHYLAFDDYGPSPSGMAYAGGHPHIFYSENMIKARISDEFIKNEKLTIAPVYIETK